MSNPVAIRAAPAVADVAGWTSQGCILDNLAPYQLLPTTNYTSNSLTPDACGSFCAGYTYFGLENGDTCYCANALNVAPCNYPGWPSYCGGKPAYPLECTEPCGGDPTYECGNALVLNLYIAGGSVASSPIPGPTVEPGNGQNIPSSSSAVSGAQNSNASPSTPVSSSGTPIATTATPDSTSSASADPAGTTSAPVSPGGRSTSTVYDTNVITAINCASTITNCPARSTDISLTSTPIAIVVYSTQWITISSCAPVITNCPYHRVSTSMVPIITINLSNNPPLPPPFTPAGSTVVPTPTPSPGNETTPGNNTIITVASGAAGNGLAWTSFAPVGILFFGMFLA